MTSITVRTNSAKNIVAGALVAKYNANGTRVLRYHVDFHHTALNLHKELSAPEIDILQRKVDALMASWDEKYEAFQHKGNIASGQDAADQLTIEAESRLNSLQRILHKTLNFDDRVNWDDLRDNRSFQRRKYPEDQPTLVFPSAPNYVEPQISLLNRLLGARDRIIEEALGRHQIEMADWEKSLHRKEAAYRNIYNDWKSKKERFEAQQDLEEAEFRRLKQEANEKVDALIRGVETGDPQAVIEHACLVLERSDYDGLFEKSFEIDYSPEARTMLLECELPSPAHVPTLKAVKFIKSTGEMRETHLTEREQAANYDSVCYQICLRTIHELLEADVHRNLERVVFNGFATGIDVRTGQSNRSCILSVSTSRAEVEAVDLARVDPKACFKSLKGVSASTLVSLSAVPPVLQMNRQDRRFVEARATVEGLQETTNLAAMDWEDFEHLVRELFEKEFAVRGGEVRVTQSSRDGGIDVVAFDPDPITGGKIVIQAKRYTRTVGVSAVRDLYGAIHNEGASRGILVTTADFGPDAHQFARGKPMTLLSGSNLLYLLEKHGVRAKIDLAEARRELNLRSSA